LHQKLMGCDTREGNQFGTSVAIDKDTIVIGAKDATGGSMGVVADAGAAYVFRRHDPNGTRSYLGDDIWEQEQRLIYDDMTAGAGDDFGQSVAIKGNTIIVGDNRHNAQRGEAYLFRHDGTGWFLDEALATDDASVLFFGWSVATNGNHVIAGAMGTDAARGNAYALSIADCNGNGEPDDCDIHVDFGGTCVGAIIPDGPCEEDVNGNGIPDSCECTTAADCPDDGLYCTDDQCVNGKCAYIADQGQCAIAGECIPDGQANSANMCQECRFAENAYDWASVPGEPVCDDDENACTEDVCISGVCTTRNFAEGTPCDDDSACSEADTCNGNGTCVPGYNPCGNLDCVDDGTGGYDCIWSSSCQTGVLTADDGSPADLFGWSAAIGIDYAFLGALSGDTHTVSNCGAVYVFRRHGAGWVQHDELNASDAAPFDDFGSSISVGGDLLIVGAPEGEIPATRDSGVAYVFKRVGQIWGEQTVLAAGTHYAPAGARFGEAVALDAEPPTGARLIVGAPEKSNIESKRTGEVYFFERQSDGTWNAIASSEAPTTGDGDKFGGVVGISGDWAIAGAPRTDDECPGNNTCDSGSAFIFRYTGMVWVVHQKLTGSNTAEGDLFGTAVAIDKDTAVIGARNAQGGFMDLFARAGAAYVFRRSDPNGTPSDLSDDLWEEYQRLINDGDNTAGAVDDFGRSVAIKGNAIIVGDNKHGAQRGEVYLFRRYGTDWTLTHNLTADDPAALLYGWSVATNGDDVIGAAVATNSGTGSAYAFRISLGEDCNGNDEPDGCDIHVDFGGPCVGAVVPDGPCEEDKNGNGVPDSCECISDADCEPDGLNCTTDACNSQTAQCEYTADQDECAINGTCVPDGQVNPDSKCQKCDTTGNPYGWSTKPDGAPCDDDNACTRVDTCDDNAACIPGDNPCGNLECVDDGTGGYFCMWPPACQTGSLTADDGWPGDFFGYSTAIGGDYAFLGAVSGDMDPVYNCGSVYVFRRDGVGWVQHDELYASDASAFDDFGSSVSVSADLLIVGAPKGEMPGTANIGAACVFKRTGLSWTEQTRLTAGEFYMEMGARFGEAVAIDGNRVIVGAPDKLDYTGLKKAGAVYFFERQGDDTWNIVGIPKAPTTGDGDDLGIAVSISGDWAIAGAPRTDDECPLSNTCDSGSAFIFRYTGKFWAAHQKLTGSNTTEGDQFGTAVAIDKDTAVVGAKDAKGGIMDFVLKAGAAYVFRRNNGGTPSNLVDDVWVEEKRLINDMDGGETDDFGRSVAIRDNVVIVGDNRHGMQRGAAYLHRHNGTEWALEEVLTAYDTAPVFFGWSVATNGEHIIGGAIGTDTGKGSAYVFSIADCNEDGEPDDCEIIANPDLDLNGNGILDSCECTSEEECDDGVFCNGAEVCTNGRCGSGGSPCSGDANLCDEQYDACVFPGDLDGDADVDLTDVDLFVQCMTGPDSAPAARCQAADADHDNGVDLEDFAVVQNAFTGDLAERGDGTSQPKTQ
jgi:hypothetical protein